MARPQLYKPNRKLRSGVEVYHNESMQIDSTSTVMEACGSCHNLGGIHQHDRTSTSAGVGISIPGGSGSATITSDGHLSHECHRRERTHIRGAIATHPEYGSAHLHGWKPQYHVERRIRRWHHFHPTGQHSSWRIRLVTIPEPGIR
jgi:hypothetical protein